MLSKVICYIPVSSGVIFVYKDLKCMYFPGRQLSPLSPQHSLLMSQSQLPPFFSCHTICLLKHKRYLLCFLHFCFSWHEKAVGIEAPTQIYLFIIDLLAWTLINSNGKPLWISQWLISLCVFILSRKMLEMLELLLPEHSH